MRIQIKKQELINTIPLWIQANKISKIICGEEIPIPDISKLFTLDTIEHKFCIIHKTPDNITIEFYPEFIKDYMATGEEILDSMREIAKIIKLVFPSIVAENKNINRVTASFIEKYTE